jgi:hypothetical protein
MEVYIMNNDELDLKLFKVCFPQYAKDKIEFVDGIYGTEVGVRGKKFITRFTDKKFGIVSIHEYLIPEMNKIGWSINNLSQVEEYHDLSTNETITGYMCVFSKLRRHSTYKPNYHKDHYDNFISAFGDTPQVAICLAANKAIDSMEGK